MRGAPGGSVSSSPPIATTHSIWLKLIFEIIGVGVLAVVAGMSTLMGKLIVALMIGFALIWFYNNAGEIESLLGKVPA